MTEIQNSGADDIKAQAENPPEEKIKKLNRDQLNENNDYNKRDRSRDPESKKKKKKDKDSKKKKKRSKERSRSRSRRKSRRSRSRSNRRRRDSYSYEKRKKSRSYSKSESKSRSKSKTPKKSNSRSKKKGFRFDSPPKDKPFFQPLPFDPITTGVLLSNPVMPGIVKQEVVNSDAMPSSLQQNANPAELLQKIQMLNTLQNMQASKSDRKLYVGNLPPNLTPQTLCEVLNSALQKMGINTSPGNSIVSAWISNDGHYAFVEFRTPEEANSGFALNNVALFQQHLKVGRPRTYAATQALQQNPMIMPGLSSLLPTLNPLNPLGVNMGGPMVPGVFGSQSTIKVQTPSRILVLKNMIQIHELEIDEEFQEILNDVTEECRKFGSVVSVKIPRPKNSDNIPGLGKIFVEYSNVEEAKEARKNLNGRTFSNNTVECSYHDERMYQENNLSEI